MAESPTYYRAYGPVFRCLQDKRGTLSFNGGVDVHLVKAAYDFV